LKVTLRKVPYVTNFEHSAEARYKFFTKKLWEGIYHNNQGYTVIFVPHYFDFVRLRTFIKNKNAQVAFVSEYSEKKSCQRARQTYESGKKPILVLTERAIVFQKIRLRYARNVIMYGVPTSIDTLTDCLGEVFNQDRWKPLLNHKLNIIKLDRELSEAKKLETTKGLLREKHTEKSLVGLFDKFDRTNLERFVGTSAVKSVVEKEGKESF
jgi:hypothetical protein